MQVTSIWNALVWFKMYQASPQFKRAIWPFLIYYVFVKSTVVDVSADLIRVESNFPIKDILDDLRSCSDDSKMMFVGL